MKDNRDHIDFAKDPVRKIFRRMFLPTLIGMVSMVILNITDGAFVGHGVGSQALAAVNIVAPLFLITAAVGLTFGIGSSVVASIHLSKGNHHAANLNITQGILASALSGLVLSALVLTHQPQACRLFGSSETLIPQACTYLRWIALLIPFNMIGMTGMFAVRLDGHPRFAMLMNCTMALANILLDYLLIFPLHMGLEGAAIATSTAFGLGNIPLIWFLLTQTRTIHLTPLRTTLVSLRLTLRNLICQAKIGLSAFIGEIAIASIMITGNYAFIRHLGEDGVAAYSVGCYCLPIVFMIGNAIVQSIQPVISFAHGQHDTPRKHEALKLALLIGALCGLAGMLIMLAGAPLITTIFLPTDSHAYQICLHGLPLYSPAFLFIAVNIVVTGYLQSTEQALSATILTLLRGFILSIPAFLLLPFLTGPDGLWLALPLAEILTLLLTAIASLQRC